MRSKGKTSVKPVTNKNHGTSGNSPPKKKKPTAKKLKKGLKGMGKASRLAMGKFGELPSLFFKFGHMIVSAIIAILGAVFTLVIGGGTLNKKSFIVFAAVVAVAVAAFFIIRYIHSPCYVNPDRPEWCDMTDKAFKDNGCKCKEDKNNCLGYLSENDDTAPESGCTDLSFEKFRDKGCDPCKCDGGCSGDVIDDATSLVSSGGVDVDKPITKEEFDKLAITVRSGVCPPAQPHPCYQQHANRIGESTNNMNHNNDVHVSNMRCAPERCEDNTRNTIDSGWRHAYFACPNNTVASKNGKGCCNASALDDSGNCPADSIDTGYGINTRTECPETHPYASGNGGYCFNKTEIVSCTGPANCATHRSVDYTDLPHRSALKELMNIPGIKDVFTLLAGAVCGLISGGTLAAACEIGVEVLMP